MSIIGKALLKSASKRLVRKYGSTTLNKVEELTHEAQENLDKKTIQRRLDGDYNYGSSYKQNKRAKRWVIFVLILFVIVAIILLLNN